MQASPEQVLASCHQRLVIASYENSDRLAQAAFSSRRLTAAPQGLAESTQHTASKRRVTDVRQHAPVDLDRSQCGEARHCFVRSYKEHRHGVVDPPSLQKVASHLHRGRLCVAQNVGHAKVQLVAMRRQDLVVHGFLYQRMAEAEAPPCVRVGLEHLVLHQFVKRRADCGAAQVGDGSQHAIAEGSSEHRRGIEHRCLLLIESVQSQQDNLRDSPWNPELRERLTIPAVFRAEDVAAIDRLTEHFFEREWAALRAFVDVVAKLLGHLVVENCLRHGANVGAFQRSQLNEVGEAASTPSLHRRTQRMTAVQLVAAIRREHEKGEAWGAAGEIVDQVTRCGIGPLQVFDDEQ